MDLTGLLMKEWTVRDKGAAWCWRRVVISATVRVKEVNLPKAVGNQKALVAVLLEGESFLHQSSGV